MTNRAKEGSSGTKAEPSFWFGAIGGVLGAWVCKIVCGPSLGCMVNICGQTFKVCKHKKSVPWFGCVCVVTEFKGSVCVCACTT